MGRAGGAAKPASREKPANLARTDRDTMKRFQQDHLRQLRDFIKELLEAVVFAREQGLADQMEQLEENMRAYCREELVGKAILAALDALTTADELENVLTTTAEEITDEQIDDHPSLQIFRERRAGGEPEVVVAAADRVLICPLSKTRFVDPVKNDPCGHVYSREAIMALLEKPRRGRRKSADGIPCPVLGCNAVVSAATLSPDPETEALLANKEDAGEEPPEIEDA
ncbi:hypothetical protein PAPYR_3830 [Paratrimastix pyriformis]|uniref:SP-RING-type domain-containing protein n=1 Tax=Paratrimastix pyriformis TaxID=342808 RepID=A0ABQ8URY6_9EUKA|nr:hypothetical protein PAPYR_3830 [Paratrimastix pyriformis]